LSCHGPPIRGKSHTDFQVALAGNPNVGKSALFNRLTGLTAITANYPGKTVELNIGVVRHRRSKFTLTDLPGTYGLDAVSEDQSVAKEALLFEHYAAVIAVVDSANMERNLYQVLQLIDLGLPIIVALNMVDHAARNGIVVDASKLEQLLGVPVLPIVAITGQGVRKLLDAIITVATGSSTTVERRARFAYAYSDLVGKFCESVRDLNANPPVQALPPGFQSRLIEGDAEIEAILKRTPDGRKIVELANALRTAIEIKENQPAQLVFTQERQRIAHQIAEESTRPIQMREGAALLGRHYAVWPPTAIPLMFGVIIGVFAFMFFVGGFLSDLISGLWGSLVSPALRLMAYGALGNGIAAGILLWGIDGGILAALSVGVPYVLTFYLVLAILEDTGYLGNVAYITDNAMRKLGLQGRSIIPLIMGLGCNVPAIMATRVLTTRRERVLASTLITLTPCSARIAVVLGAVAYIVGWQYAVAVFLIDLAVIGAIGKALSLVLPGESSGLVMEMFPFHMPSLRSILSKTWFRFKAFVFVAFPVVIVGSVFLGGLFELGFLNTLTEISGPTLYAIVGLPPVAAIALILGILRKELTLQLLVALAVMQYGTSAHSLTVFMSPAQLFVFAIVVTLYFPCVATMSLLSKEMGWKNTVAIMTGDIVIALIIGAAFFHLLTTIQFA
jgi:ferrous iron transport protein B